MARKNIPALEVVPPSGSALVGVARRDITPPVGIYARMWGAAKHDRSEGTHKPLSTTALTIRKSKNDKPLVLVSIDLALLGDLGGVDDERAIMGPVLDGLGVDRRHIIVNCTHTHSAPWTALSRAHMPGGDLLPGYQNHLGVAIREAVREALATAVPATFTWATGRCSLAANRDLPDPDKSKKRIVCGYNPNLPADDTVVVGRVTRDGDGSVLATVVNYACHPTTLAWDNRLISPDFIGAMRETIECHTGDAPCLFLQGASGELAPAHDYVGDTDVADKHGRQLGFAALSALESMLAPRHKLTYRGVMESGAPLAVWLPEKFQPSTLVASDGFDIPLPLKKMPTVTEMEAKIAACKDRTMAERLFRKLQIVKTLGGSGTFNMPAWVWRIGSSLIIAHPNEAYSCFQQDLREAFPGFAVVVMNTSGAELGYINPPAMFDKNVYQVWQTPFDKPALGVLTKTCIQRAKKLVALPDKRGR
ncbi:MAG: neutral/alkaline non-lysosomal ceramidase N-terminal domain-containing protein [Planctomycetes bacterium]|nr:neutral/alkaline non-lysosomal ceramidase N-terminal domain-containing protein [Planctomycetota bacterium]